VKKIKQLSAVGRVWLVLAAVFGILLIVGGMFFFSFRGIEQRHQAEQSRVARKLALVNQINQHLGRAQASVTREVLASDQNEIRILDQAVGALSNNNISEIHDLQSYRDHAIEGQLHESVARANAAYWDATGRLMALARANLDTEATTLINAEQAPAYDQYQQFLDKLIVHLEADAGESASSVASLISKTTIIGDSLVVMALLAVIGVAIALAGVARQIREDNRQLQEEVSERKRTGEQLLLKTALLEAQVNSTLDGIVVVDERRKTSLQNQRFVDLFNFPPGMAEEEADENRLQWVTNRIKDPEPFFQKVLHLYSHPNESSHDEIELKDGKTLDRYSSPAIGKDGKYYGRIWTYRDITERKKLEAKSFQSKKMETVGKLAGGIAHEFNSILTAIIGQSELLLAEVPAQSPLARNAMEINQAAGRAATLTRHLLAYGRKQLLQPEALDLNRVIIGMESVFRLLMGVDVDTKIVPAQGLRAVMADAGQIEEVIMNIVINARDAMPHGGKLTLETANVSFDEESVDRYPELKAGDYVMLAISDTGGGIPDEVKPRLFEPFFTTKGVGQGTGLGLSTCYGIVKQSSGHISVYSEIGRGATFKIYLPQVREEAANPVRRAAAPALPRGGETILLVEDDPALREMAGTLLKRLGYTVWVAANGIEALSLKQQRNVGHIDLLFTDVVMPHMSGKELADRVAALYPHTKILFTTAYTESAIVHQGVLDAGVALLKKPFTPSALARKIREVLGRANHS
jgi:C4-dicarboxylate-specific signal transduction histidine kinase